MKLLVTGLTGSVVALSKVSMITPLGQVGLTNLFSLSDYVKTQPPKEVLMAQQEQYISDSFPYERVRELTYIGGTWVETRDAYFWWSQNVSYKNWASKPSSARPFPDDLIQATTAWGPYERITSSSNYEVRHHPLAPVPWSNPWMLRERWQFQHNLRTVPQYIENPLTVNTRHLLKIRGKSDDYSQALAEVDRAADGFVDAARAISRIWKRIKGKSRKKLTACDASSAHLGVQFGIKPVISDLVMTMDHLIREEENRLVRIHSHREQSESITDSNGDKWKAEYSHEIISYIRLNNTAGSLINLGSPGEWAYERIPFSFVVDWLFTAGDVVAAYGAGRGLDHITTMQITKNKTALVSQVPSQYFSVLDRGQLSGETYNRVKSFNLPLPGRVEFEPTRSLQALGNAFALLNAVSSKCRKSGYRSPKRY